MSNFAHYRSQFDSDLILECILWDNPEALSVILQTVTRTTFQYRYSGYSFKVIADFLGHSECVRILAEYCEKCDRKEKLFRPTSRHSNREHQNSRAAPDLDASPFTAILELHICKQRHYDFHDICKLLLKISTERYDINQRNANGMTPVHIAIETINYNNVLLENILATLFRQGADGNVQDINGRSALYMTLTPYNSPLGYTYMYSHYKVLRMMKTVLYYNAVPKYTPNAIHHAMSRDEMNSFLRYVDDNSITITLTKHSEDGHKLLAETTRDRLLALSFVAILIELGFPVGKSVTSSFSNLPNTLKRYLNETIYSPRSLKSRCRNIIRDTYPGPKLLKFLKSSRVPDSIANVILFKQYLLRTQIILASGKLKQNCAAFRNAK